MFSDEQLVERVKRGDEDAFARLLAKCEPMLWKIARRHKGPYAEMEDAVQTARIALHRAAMAFNPAIGFKFFTFGYSTCLGAVRELKRKAAVDMGLRYCDVRRGTKPVRPASLDAIYLEEGTEALDNILGRHDDQEFHARAAFDALLSGCRDERERLILAAMIRGETMVSLSTMLGISNSRICQIRNSIRERAIRMQEFAGFAFVS
jgi:RNA polymerase sigma factor (sigma-70 family)